MREDKLQIKFDEETLACYGLPEGILIQVCPSGVYLVRIAKEESPSELLNQKSYDGCKIRQTCMDKLSQVLFVLASN